MPITTDTVKALEWAGLKTDYRQHILNPEYKVEYLYYEICQRVGS
jgi:hypothetical protein